MTKRKHEEEIGIKPLDTILAVAMGLIILVNGIIGLFVKKGESPYILGKGFNVAFWIAFGIAVVNLVIRYFARGSAVKKVLMVIDLILMAVEVGIGFFVLQTVVDYFKNGSSSQIEAFLADTKLADAKLMAYLIVAAVALLLFMILLWAEKSTRKAHTMNVLIIIGAYLVLLVIDYWYVIVVLLIIVAGIAVIVGLIMLGVKTSRPRSSKSSSSGSSSSRSSYSSSSYSSSHSSSSSSSSSSSNPEAARYQRLIDETKEKLADAIHYRDEALRNVAEAEKNGGRLLLRTADDFRDDVKKYEYKIEEYQRKIEEYKELMNIYM